MDDDIEDYIDCLEGGLRDEVKNIVFALNNDRNQDRDPRTRLATWSFKISCYYQTSFMSYHLNEKFYLFSQ